MACKTHLAPWKLPFACTRKHPHQLSTLSAAARPTLAPESSSVEVALAAHSWYQFASNGRKVIGQVIPGKLWEGFL